MKGNFRIKNGKKVRPRRIVRRRLIRSQSGETAFNNTANIKKLNAFVRLSAEYDAATDKDVGFRAMSNRTHLKVGIIAKLK